MTTSTATGPDEGVLSLGEQGGFGHLTIEAPGTLTTGDAAPSIVTAPEAQQALVLGGDMMPASMSQTVVPHGQSVNAGDTSGGGSAAQMPLFGPSATTHITINATFDASVTTATGITANYESAVNSAIQFFESEITTAITVDIHFGWGEVGGATIDAGALGESSSSNLTYSYSDIYNAVQGLTGKSAVQSAAYATLPATDPTGGGTFNVTTAQAAALGLQSNAGQLDGSVGLDATSAFFWSQSQPQAGSYDAVSTFEHEISEVLGRSAEGGKNSTYTLLDMFRYTAADQGTADAPGSAVGGREEPFAGGYNANTQSYFSYNGSTVTLPFDTNADVLAGNDVADWGPTVNNDSFGGGSTGAVAPVSTTDLQVMNVLGYSLAAACYAAGTRIATALGEVPIEALRVGDAVRLAGGGTAPVIWLGYRRVDCARHKNPETVWPVRVRAHAFGDRVPARDLLLSPDHAVLADGVLIPIRCLINGATIAQERRDRVTYWHVELPRHAAILAEGLAAESYLDTGNRAAFENAGAVVEAHPDFAAGAEAAWRAGACAPQVTHGAALERVRRRVLTRAEALGWRRREVRPVLRGAGRVLPGPTEDGEWRVMLPAGLDEVVLTSDAGVPRDAGESPETRLLGVAIRGMALDGVAIPLDDARFGSGWHAAEEGWRWTDGAGAIRVAGARLVSLRLAMAARCWVAPAEAPQVARRVAG
jgi:hypothetical protein